MGVDKSLDLGRVGGEASCEVVLADTELGMR